ncbi:MAG: nucleotidyl transferase [Bryobacterales bacterium]|nr:nucleotidyl transferase [Bryobacterales bacterium]
MLPVIILAGGLATRLRPITAKIPKALAEVNGEPFLAHQLRLLRANGFERVVMSVAYLGEMIRDFAGDGSSFGLRIQYSFDGPSYLGTAGAIRKALPLLGDAFFSLYGDSYLPCNYSEIETRHRESGRLALMTVFKNDGLFDTSNVEFAGGEILAYDKKHRTPEMRYIDYGLGVFRAEAFQMVPDGGAADLADLYARLLRMGQLAAYEARDRFYEVGTVAGLRDTEAFLRS